MRLLVLVVVGGCGRVGFDHAADVGGSGQLGTYVQAVMADQPVAYWRLDETTGTIAHDETGTYPGTYDGGCTLGVIGALSSGDHAVKLDGSSCRIVISDVLEFAGQTPFSIDLWVSMAVSNAAVRWIVSHLAVSPKSGYAISFVNNTLWFEQDLNGNALAYTAATEPSLGTFHHVAITTNGTRQRIYVDGVMAVQTPFTVVEPASTGSLILGDYLLPDPSKLQGTLDDVAVYATELSPEAVAAHFAAR